MRKMGRSCCRISLRSESRLGTTRLSGDRARRAVQRSSMPRHLARPSANVLQVKWRRWGARGNKFSNFAESAARANGLRTGPGSGPKRCCRTTTWFLLEKVRIHQTSTSMLQRLFPNGAALREVDTRRCAARPCEDKLLYYIWVPEITTPPALIGDWYDSPEESG